MAKLGILTAFLLVASVGAGGAFYVCNFGGCPLSNNASCPLSGGGDVSTAVADTGDTLAVPVAASSTPVTACPSSATCITAEVTASGGTGVAATAIISEATVSGGCDWPCECCQRKKQCGQKKKQCSGTGELADEDAN